MRMVTLLAASWFLSCLTSAAVAERLRPRPDGLVDDFEGALRWRPRRDGGHPPAFEVSSNDPHGGRQCLRINYADRPPNWGSIEKEIAITGKETALVLWVRVERAEPKAAMHVWLMERDGDGWLARVKSDGQTLLADFPQGEWVRARIPLVDFEFQARGQGSRELSQVNVMVLNFNFASSTVYVDDIAFEVPPEVKADLLARQEKDERTRQQVISRIQPRGSRRGVVAIFRDVVPPPVEGRASDPEYLAQLLRSAGYGVAFLTAREMAAPGVLDPQVFDIVVLPYGPRFPGEAADTFRDYLTGGGRFISMGGYAFDELYSGGPESGRSQLIANGSFEEAGTDENQPSAWLLPQGAGLTVRRDNTRARTGSSSLYIAAADAAPVTWYIARQRLDSPAPSVRYLLSGFVRVRNIHDGPGAYIGVDFYRADGSRISFSQSHIVGRTEDWTQLSVEFSVPDGTAYMTANCILYARGEAWFDDIELRAVPASLNTRRATARDMLHISDDQIPVFDPSFRLDQVAELRAAERQFVASADLQIRADLEGYAAVGLWGKNTPVAPEPYARWVPLLRTYDQFGHLRGTAGALLFHHDGPWQGSTWAFFGITNVDLFRRGDDKMARFFLRLVDHMLRGIYLSCPEPALMCYRDGEQVSARVLVGNNGRRAAEVEVRAKILEGESGKLVAECPAQTVMLEPGNRATAEFAFPRFDFDTDLYEVRFTASAGDSPVDQVSTGFCVWHKDVVSRGPDVRWRDNYLHLGDAQAGT
ncbi:MAG: hypothetical protein H5T86_12400, partial [Armatimonadetes bacterium]|nr:hypothetical protein [Armatimonadota bacterium]